MSFESDQRVGAAPPVLTPPPQIGPDVDPSPPHKPKRSGPIAAILSALAVAGKYLLGLGKFILPILKFAKLGKILLTGGTMLLSVWFYALLFGWQFAIGFVICIFVHELGHVVMAAREGVPVTAPIFLPGFGAMILLKQGPRTAWSDALIGIGGPVAGTLAGLGCWGIYSVTGNYLFLALATTAFLMNLFNLLPVMPLDGGRITGAVSPYLWAIGLVVLIGMFVTGYASNPFIFVLVILSLPRLWHGLRTGSVAREGETLTRSMKLSMGVAYLALAGFLAWGMTATQSMLPDRSAQAAHSRLNRGPVQ
jgi:Zn-dependent protease